MDSYFKDYRELQRFISHYRAYDALAVVWRASATLKITPTRRKYAFPLNDYEFVTPSDLPLIVREIVLNAGSPKSRKARFFKFLTTVIRHIRNISNEADGRSLSINDVQLEIVRILHRQIPGQGSVESFRFLRYYKLYKSKEIAPYIESYFGLSIKKLMLIAALLMYEAKRNFIIEAKNYLIAKGISEGQISDLIKRLATPIEALKEEYKALQAFDKDWEYSWNPLETRPLILIEDKIVCPVPELLFNRFGFGVYYDLCKMPGFDNAWGDAFEEYIGELLEKIFKAPTYVIHKEKPYEVKKQQRHGVDWILEGNDGNVFIECKTKRMTQGSRANADLEAIKKDISVLADAVIQLYKNVSDAAAGLTTWKPNNLPTYLLVITLEDWFIASSTIVDMLDEVVREKMQQQNISQDLLKKWPYGCISARDFEEIASAVRDVGIDKYFFEKQTSEYRSHLWREYTRENFPNVTPENALMTMSDELLEVIA